MIWFVIGIAVGVMITYVVNRYNNTNSVTKQEQLTTNERRLFELIENTKDFIYYFETKPKWKYTYMCPSFEKILGKEQVKLAYEQPQLILDRVHPDDYNMLLKKINGDVDYSKPIIYRIANNQGIYLTFEEFTTPVYKDGELVAIQGILRNITEKLKLQEQLEYRSTHDGLTNIYNRQFFEDVMRKYNHKEDASIGIVICDLDELKHTNDTLGHQQGDHLIKAAANLMNTYSSDNVIVSRIGGDEFAIFITNSDKIRVEELVERLRKDTIIYNKASNKLAIRMSIGYAYSNQSIGKLDSLFVESDQNMYEDKQRRKNRKIGYELEVVG